MRTITKDKKMIILYFLIIFIAILAMISISNEFKADIAKLEVEISELENQKDNLLQLKAYYEELIKLQEELEENLNLQIEVLENDLSKSREENEQLRTIRAKLTAYSPLDNVDGQQAEGNPNRTSIGKQVGKYIVAADPKKLPYGTKLEIPGIGICEVADTGGALRRDNKNIRIDVFKNTYPEAIKFGVKDLDVKILEWGGE